MERNYLTVPISMFFNQFILSPFRSFLVIVLYELGFSPYEIGTIIAIADVSALVGSILGPTVSDYIGRKNSSALGRALLGLGMILMYFTFGHNVYFIASLAIAQVGLLWGRGASYVLVGETTRKRVSFSSFSLAINDAGGLIGLLIFVHALDGKEAIVIFREFMPLRATAAFLSSLSMFLSRETMKRRTNALPRLDGKFLRYLAYIAIAFFGMAIVRTFSPLYAKNFIGVSDQTRGFISMLSIGFEALFFLIISRINPPSTIGFAGSIIAYAILASFVVLRPTKTAAIIGFGIISPLFTSLRRPSMWDFDMHISPAEARGKSVSIIFAARRLGLTGGRLCGARLFVIDPRLVIIAPLIFFVIGGVNLIRMIKREF